MTVTRISALQYDKSILLDSSSRNLEIETNIYGKKETIYNKKCSLALSAQMN